ncbi:MAG: hypothetical protein R3E86_15630 [Pseudomonadales bacterium]
MTSERLRAENLAFAGTCGVSEHARQARFMPAFQDTETGRVEICCFASGTPAPMHLICCLPDEWAIAWNDQGEVAALKPSVVAGFVRDDRFYTREEAACLANDVA